MAPAWSSNTALYISMICIGLRHMKVLRHKHPLSSGPPEKCGILAGTGIFRPVLRTSCHILCCRCEWSDQRPSSPAEWPAGRKKQKYRDSINRSASRVARAPRGTQWQERRRRLGKTNAAKKHRETLHEQPQHPSSSESTFT